MSEEEREAVEGSAIDELSEFVNDDVEEEFRSVSSKICDKWLATLKKETPEQLCLKDILEALRDSVMPSILGIGQCTVDAVEEAAAESESSVLYPSERNIILDAIVSAASVISKMELREINPEIKAELAAVGQKLVTATQVVKDISAPDEDDEEDDSDEADSKVPN